MKSLSSALILAITLAISSATVYAVQFCLEMPHNDGPTIWGTPVIVPFGAQVHDQALNEERQAATVAGADSKALNRTMELKSITDKKQYHNTTIFVNEKLLPGALSSSEGGGLNFAKMVLEDEAGGITTWRLPRFSTEVEYSCNMITLNVEKLKQVSISLDQIRNVEMCPLATVGDLQAKWDTAVDVHVVAPELKDQGKSTENLQSLGGSAMTGKLVRYMTSSYTSPVLSKLDLGIERIEKDASKAISRTLVTIILATPEKTKIQYVLKGGMDNHYKCYDIYSLKKA